MIDQQHVNPAFMYQGQTPQQVQKFSNSLTKEEIEQLTKQTSSFNLRITNEERLRGICNHRTADGMGDAITRDEITGALKCQICGYSFRQADPNMTADEIKDAIVQVIDLLQTTKLMFIDMPVESAREYYQIIPLLEKVPKLFEIAAKNMVKHETYGWNMKNPNMSAYAMFQNLSNIYGNGAFMGQPMGMGAAPQYGQPQPMAGNPYMAQPQPMMGNPYMAQPQPMGPSNGFMYTGAPQGGYQPQNAGFSYNPGGVAPATPTVPQQLPGEVVDVQTAPAPEASAETTVQQTVKA